MFLMASQDTNSGVKERAREVLRDFLRARKFKFDCETGAKRVLRYVKILLHSVKIALTKD